MTRGGVRATRIALTLAETIDRSAFTKQWWLDRWCRWPLLPIAMAALFGVWCDAIWQPAWEFSAAALATSGLILTFLFCRHRTIAQSRPITILALTIVLVASLFAWRHHVSFEFQTTAASSSPTIDANVTNTLEHQPIIFRGVVDSVPRLKRTAFPNRVGATEDESSPYETILRIRMQSRRHELSFLETRGTAMVIIRGDCTHWQPGDGVEILGNESHVSGPSNPGQTDLRQWMSRERLDHIVYASTVRRAPADAIGQLDSVRLMGLRLFASFSRSGRHVLLETVGTEHGPLALALILGQRDLLQPDVRDRLLVTGTAHLLSVSGLHLAIVLGLVRLIASLLDCSQTAQIIGMLAIGIFYVALTGGRPPVIRAAVLIATLLLAWWVGRVNQPVNSLSLAAIVLAWLMPGEVFSIGILLSFVAVATLLTTSPQNPRGKTAAALAISLESRFDEIELQSRGRWYRWASWCSRGVIASLWLSCSVTAMTLPLVWHQFHVVSWISVFVNVILSALMIAALTTGIATVVIGWLTGGVIASFATVPATLCRWTLQTMDQILIVFENMSYGHVWLPSPPTVWIVAFYLGVLAIVALTHREKRRFWFIGWLALWTSIGVVMATRVSPLPAGTLEATFVDVGHGTAVIMRTKPDAVWLYDCGSMGNATGRRRDIEETLWSMGVTRLHTVCLSHADADHFNGLPSLARRFRIDQVVTPPGMLSETEPALDMIRQTINRYHLPVKTASCTEFTDGLIPSEVSVIHPPAQRLVGSDNANSIVMRIDHGGRSFILPGDLEPPGTESVLNQDRPLPGGVLMAPHHGSTRMRADEVLQWARPAWTIVSGGRRAAQPKVREMLSSAGGRVAITARQGAIRVRMDADGNLDVRSWKDDPW